MSQQPQTLRQFYAELETNRDCLESFQLDFAQYVQDSGLTPEAKSAVLSCNFQRIRDALAAESQTEAGDTNTVFCFMP